MKRARIQDIADAVGVSAAAASFALNGKPGVSEAVRRKVLDAAETMGWQPNVAARSLAGARAGAIGLVIARTTDSFGTENFFLRLIAGIEQSIASRSLSLVLQLVDSVEAEIATYRRWYSEHRVDGVLLVDLRVDDPRPAVLTELSLPAVVIGGPESFGLPHVTISDDAAMRIIVAHLVAQGHTHIAYVSGLSELSHTQSRIDAFEQASAAAGIIADPAYSTDYSAADGSRATIELLIREPRATAVIFDNEVLAIAGLSELADAGLAVPEQMAVVAWEDSPIWLALRPHLTALRRDPTVLGNDGATALLAAIDGEPVQTVAEPVPTLIIRESTGG
ncbi:LacI family DNA-binding transcriptional regulator [Lacisediminihabitans changchengi]|uniref:LacI family DNA-binding transcriptional regulator n=1 Tax=Lacisediminihabitans changchengi TaxID=2787634 RepID=A0A934W0X5_9MICO|nr:LacI family DNA-binding transcriptional regulator [Lacisediminihabitans changchengi]MBK4346293.1 LacI family DNA-binding transcriptional regulator [Lacisediminihabitans changchengi]